MCKHGNVFSLAVLIGRGLDLDPFKSYAARSFFFPFCFIQFSGYRAIRTDGLFCYLSSCFNPQSRPVGAAFFCLSPLYQSSAVESTVSPEPSGLAAEDFSSSEGDFTYLELEYGTPAQVVLPLFGLSGAEPDRKWESNGGGFHSEYRAGAMNMDGASFGLTLGFLDGLLNSFTFTCDAQEGEDLTPLYEDLRAQLGSLYGLPEEESVLEDVLAPAQEERGKDLLYDIQRFSSVVEEEGERVTRLSLSLIELDGAGVQVELSLGLYQ